MSDSLMQNMPNSREKPPRTRNIFAAFSQLGNAKSTLIYLSGGLGFFLLVFVSITIKNTINGTLWDVSFITSLPFAGVVLTLILLFTFIWLTLSRERNRHIQEQKRYYELGKVEPLNSTQQKALRLELADMYYSGFWVNTLEYYPCEIRVDRKLFTPATFSIADAQTYKRSINDDWGIVSAPQYRQMVVELLNGMHAKQFALDMEYTLNVADYLNPYQQEEEKNNIKIQNNAYLNQLAGLIEKPVSYVESCCVERNEKPKQLIWGFDLWRVLPMSRNAYMAGYISEEEAWEHILRASELAYYLFDSYESFYDNYRLGNAYWSNNLDTTSNRLQKWKLYEQNCDWEERNISWTYSEAPVISEEMKTGFANYVAGRLKKQGSQIGFKR